jgi:hypothetical protein
MEGNIIMTADEQKREYVLNAIASYPSQQQAAQAIGTCPRVVSQWNTNKAKPRDLAVRVVQLLQALQEAGIEPPPPLIF